jgi:hypothetical protein
MSVIQKLLKVTLFVNSALCASLVNAEACTYNEALMAFQKGNTVRGQALLTMAVKDGDQRAVALFSALQEAVRDGRDYDVADVIQMADSAGTVK